MKLTLTRAQLDPDVTIGRLLVDGAFASSAALALGYVSPQEFDTWVQPSRMV